MPTRLSAGVAARRAGDLPAPAGPCSPDDVANAASVPSEPTRFPRCRTARRCVRVPSLAARSPHRSRPRPRSRCKAAVVTSPWPWPRVWASGYCPHLLQARAGSSLVLVTVLVLLGVAEAYAAVRRGGYHPATLLGLVAAVSLMVATYTKGQAGCRWSPCSWSPSP